MVAHLHSSEESVVNELLLQHVNVSVVFNAEFIEERFLERWFEMSRLHEFVHHVVSSGIRQFAKDVSEFDTLKELKADIKKKMTAERTEAAQRAFEDVLMAKVAEGVEAEIPHEMVELQAERMMEQFKQQLAAQGIPFDQYLQMTGTTEADFRKQADGPAAEQVKMDLAVEAVIKAEGLEATDEDVENELKNVAEKYGMDLETVKKYLRPEDVKEQVIREKAVKVVADSAVAVAPAEEKAELEAEGEVVEKKPAKKPAAKKTAKKDAEKDAE